VVSFLRFHHENLYAPVTFPIRAKYPATSRPFLFDYPKSIGWGIQIIKLLIMLFLLLLSYLIPLRSKWSPQPPIPKILNLFLPSVWATKFHTHKKNGQNYDSVYLNPTQTQKEAKIYTCIPSGIWNHNPLLRPLEDIAGFKPCSNFDVFYFILIWLNILHNKIISEWERSVPF
jgi:hypothetical protein